MNGIEAKIVEIVSEEKREPKTKKIILLDGTQTEPDVEWWNVALKINVYGNIQPYEMVCTKFQWETIKEQGYVVV
ncbi:hypothetical protein [Bacillus phage vB_BceS-M2]